ncbi:hypothetical protein B0H11DRAFT_2289062 [Mycena galericulata]|nr:hypothetical protein B0H11DRAFT_2290425 [Mycena galericulata]KAJ7451228.1 hypothetical protein B0H11DRAFT_2289062 [Mycena galericulata]
MKEHIHTPGRDQGRHPAAPPCRVVQLQYLGWPDMNVPENAQGVLGLVWEVGRVVEEVAEAARAGAGAMEEDTEDNYAATTDRGNESGSDSEVDDATGVLRRALKVGGGSTAGHRLRPALPSYTLIMLQES